MDFLKHEYRVLKVHVTFLNLRKNVDIYKESVSNVKVTKQYTLWWVRHECIGEGGSERWKCPLGITKRLRFLV